MKKLLAFVLASTSVVSFADSFQDFNNNVYAGFNNTSINQGQYGNSNSWTLGSTIQTKNNIWLNAEANDSTYSQQATTALNTQYGIGSNFAQALVTAKAGYAFQILNGEENGYQVIPYATYTYGTTMTFLNQYYGLGVKQEYRLFDTFKAALDLTGYDLTQSGNGPVQDGLHMGNGVNPSLAGQSKTGYVQDFRFTVNPEVQYDIAKTILVAAGYKYDQSWNKNTPNTDGNSTVYLRAGYLF